MCSVRIRNSVCRNEQLNNASAKNEAFCIIQFQQIKSKPAQKNVEHLIVLMMLGHMQKLGHFEEDFPEQKFSIQFNSPFGEEP